MSDASWYPPEPDDRFIPEWMVDGGETPPPTSQELAVHAAAPTAEPTEEDRARQAIEAVTSKGITGMSAAERVAVLTAVKDAIEDQLKREKSGLIENFTGATKSHSLPTALGDLTFKPETPKIVIDGEKLLDYVAEHHPEYLTTRTIEVREIPDEIRAQLTAVVDVGDGMFASPVDGTAVDYASYGTPTAASIAYPASRQQKVTKALARRGLSDQFLAIALPMMDTAEGEKLL